MVFATNGILLVTLVCNREHGRPNPGAWVTLCADLRGLTESRVRVPWIQTQPQMDRYVQLPKLRTVLEVPCQ